MKLEEYDHLTSNIEIKTTEGLSVWIPQELLLKAVLHANNGLQRFMSDVVHLKRLRPDYLDDRDVLKIVKMTLIELERQ